MLRSILALALACLPLAAQSFAGDWRGDIKIPGAPLEVVVVLQEHDGALTGTIDIPAQQAKALPLEQFVRKERDLTFVIADVPGTPTFAGGLDVGGNELAGTFSQGGQPFPFTLRRAAAAAESAHAQFDGVAGWLDETREMFAVPGCAAVVVKRGDVLATFPSGQRDVGQRCRAEMQGWGASRDKMGNRQSPVPFGHEAANMARSRSCRPPAR